MSHVTWSNHTGKFSVAEMNEIYKLIQYYFIPEFAVQYQDYVDSGRNNENHAGFCAEAVIEILNKRGPSIPLPSLEKTLPPSKREVMAMPFDQQKEI